MASRQNFAAWSLHRKAEQFVVKENTYTAPGPGEIVVRNESVAINPIDWMLQDEDVLALPYPNVFGCDVAGEVVELGSGVSGFKIGQRVIGHALGMDTGLVKYAGFQTYTVLKAVLVSVIPMTMSFSQAVVLPCALSTAAAGLFQATALSMSKPSIDPQDQGASVLIWGGSSSVGSCAIQLARAAGYKVVTTASSRNFQYCKDLGAAAVFDHTSSSAEEQILDALRGDILVGALDSISSDSTIRACAQILSAFEPHQTRRLAITNPMLLSSIPGNVETVHVLAGTIADDDIGPAIYEHYLPKALKQGCFIPKPDSIIAGHGLEAVQGAVTRLKGGVSASKLVVNL